jgi:Fe-S cluster assembly iron-binding protein IscA
VTADRVSKLVSDDGAFTGLSKNDARAAAMTRTSRREVDLMVEVSQQADVVLDEVRKAYKIPSSYGLRLYGEPTEEGDHNIVVSFCEAPAPGDEVIEEFKTKIFVAPEVADRLQGASLQAKPGPRPVIAIEYADA